MSDLTGHTSASRAGILAKIRGAQPPVPVEARDAAYAAIDRGYLRTGTLSAAERLEMFEERLIEYDARVHRVSNAVLPRVVAAAIAERGARRIAIAAGVPAEWLPRELSFAEADLLSNRELSEFDGVVSGCTVAIALTGTIILQNAAAQGPRKLSLVPDYHLCIVFADQIVETVPEALDRLAATGTLPTTFISGPSATADIEMTRIKGVHGPRFLDVLIVC
jgi:L-lactate dehydrogenase complex protein LldG